MQRLREAQTPRSLRAKDGRAGRPFRDIETTEFAIAPTTGLPLNPSDASKASSDPAIEGLQLAPLTEAEVASPSPKVWDQLTNHPFQGDSPESPGQFPDTVFEPSQRFVGDTALKRRIVSHSKPEKRPVPRSVNGTFICIDLKLETPFNETGQIFHDPSASLFAAHVDVAIIRVTHESVATAFKLTIQLIQHEIREQGRERATLRGPFPTVLEYPVIEHTGCQKAPNESEQSPICNSRRHRSHQTIMVHPVKRRHDRLPITKTMQIRSSSLVNGMYLKGAGSSSSGAS